MNGLAVRREADTAKGPSGWHHWDPGRGSAVHTTSLLVITRSTGGLIWLSHNPKTGAPSSTGGNWRLFDEAGLGNSGYLRASSGTHHIGLSHGWGAAVQCERNRGGGAPPTGRSTLLFS